MSFDDLFSRLVVREGGYSNDPEDAGGRTQFGVSEAAHPEMWTNGPPSLQQARDFYEREYFVAPHFDQVKHPGLQEQLFDFGVNSGMERPVKLLQKILGVTVDGVLGPKTLKALNASGFVRINNLLMKARVSFLARQKARFRAGLVDRALEFLIV